MEAVHYIDPESADTMAARMEQIKNQVQIADQEDILFLIDQLERDWKLGKKGDTHLPFTIGFEKFCTPDELNEHGVPVSIDVERISDQ